VVIVFEEAHWIDPTSRELLDLVVERAGSLPVLWFESISLQERVRCELGPQTTAASSGNAVGKPSPRRWFCMRDALHDDARDRETELRQANHKAVIT
jgi:hypothetical protein